jgi:uncharacterized membrane protein YidH (DUF202 family)
MRITKLKIFMSLLGSVMIYWGYTIFDTGKVAIKGQVFYVESQPVSYYIYLSLIIGVGLLMILLIFFIKDE